MTNTEAERQRATAIISAEAIKAGRCLWPALSALVLRRACVRTRAELNTVGDTRWLTIRWSKEDLLAVLEVVERATTATGQVGD